MSQKNKNRKALIYSVFLPTFIVVLLLIYDFHFLYSIDHGRGNGEKFVKDVRIMNTYLGHLLLVISVLLGFFGKELMRKNLKENPSLLFFMPLVIAIITACLSLIFFPVPYGENIKLAKFRWLFSLFCQQTAVVFTCVGLLAIIFIYNEDKIEKN